MRKSRRKRCSPNVEEAAFASGLTEKEPKNKQSGNGIGIGAALGVAFGATYGFSSGNTSLSIALGLAIGVAVGAIFDITKNKK
ncbi:MAG: hypothetical protein ACOYNC_09055 [Bacteroidales bacterium]